jgi:HK97 family phage portal protein
MGQGRLSKLTAWIAGKAQTDNTGWLDGSLRLLEGSGTYGAKPWPFDYNKAVWQCQSWVYRCAFGNANAAAAQPLRLYVRKLSRSQLKARGFTRPTMTAHPVSRRQKRYLRGDDGHGPSAYVRRKLMSFGDDFEQVDEHPAVNLLRTVNPYMNGYDMAVLRFASLELTGNAYMHPVMGKVLGREIPVSLWPMLPQWTKAIPGGPDTGALIDGYTYGQTTRQEVVFAPDEVGHFRYPNPRDLIYGLGKVEAAWSALNLQNSERVMQIALFDNHARPDYVAIAKDGTTTEQLDRFESKVKGLMRGVQKAGQFLALSGNIELKPLQFPPKELGDRPEVIEEIAGVFGYPVTKLKANDPNRANAETGDAGWMKDTILPMLRGDEEKLNEWLLPLFGIGDDACFAYDDPVPANRTFELERSRVLLQSGQITLNEAREDSGQDKYDNPLADEPMVASGSVPLSMLKEQLTAGLQSGGMFGGPFNNPGGVAPTPAREPITPAPERPEASTGAIKPEEPATQETAQNIVEGEKLNGAQITAAKDVLSDVAAGNMARLVAVELLVAVGIDHPRAERMVSAAIDDTPNKPEAGEAKSIFLTTDTATRIEAATIEQAQEQAPEGVEVIGELIEEIDADRVFSHRALMLGDVKCCHVKAETGDAEDTVRDLEPEGPAAQLAAKLREIFAQQQGQVLAALGVRKGKAKPRAKMSEEDIAAIMDRLKFDTDAMAGEVEEMVREMFRAGGKAGLEKVGISLDFDVTNARVAEAIRNYSIRLAGEVNAVSLTRLSNTLSEGVAAGEAVGDLSARVTDTFEDFSNNRAEMIARTESARAYVDGEIEGWEDSGVVVGKKWLLAANSCEFCRAAAKEFAATTVGLRDAFYKQGTALRGVDGGVMQLDYSDVNGAPLHPHCRCDLIAVTDE